MAELENANLKNAYTDAPEPRDNQILASLQLFVWLFFHPSAWRHHLARVEPGLRPDFCLAELRPAQWRRSALARLLLRGYLVGPLTLGLVVALAMGVLGVKSSDVAFGVPFVLVCGLTFGLMAGWTLSLAVGLVGVAAAGLVVILTAAGQAGVAIIFTGGLASGLVIGLIGATASRLAGQVADWSWLRRLGRIVVCLVVAGLLIVLGFVLADSVADELEASHISSSSALTFGVGMGLIFGTAAAVWLSLPYLMGDYFAGSQGGVVVSLAAVGGPLSVIFWLDGTISVGAILLGWLGMLIGLTGGTFWSLLLYPLSTVWNGVLYLIDVRRSGARLHLFRWHPAFWDEYQPLPWLGLERHLRLVWARDPAEAQAALAYLADSRQAWVAQKFPNPPDTRQ